MKKKKMNLEPRIASSKYEVVSVVNSVHPRIGEWLSEADARKYCNDPHWTVTIKGAKK